LTELVVNGVNGLFPWGTMHVMGGQVNFSSDGMDAVSPRYRTAAFQGYLAPTPMGNGGLSEDEAKARNASTLLIYQTLFNPALNFSYVRQPTKDGPFEFLGGYEFNHLNPDVVGPLISETYGEDTQFCPSHLTAKDRKEQCLSLQLMVWGTELLEFLNSTKNALDPDMRFNCTYCVGNDFWPIKPRPNDISGS